MVFFVLVDRGECDVGAIGDGFVDTDDLLGRRQRRAHVGAGPNGDDEVLDHRVHESLARSRLGRPAHDQGVGQQVERGRHRARHHHAGRQ